MNLDDYIKSVNTTVDGEYIEVLRPVAFKAQLECFKEVIAEELPEFTLEEIIKYYRLSNKLKQVYRWVNIEHLLTAIELENEQ